MPLSAGGAREAFTHITGPREAVCDTMVSTASPLPEPANAADRVRAEMKDGPQRKRNEEDEGSKNAYSG